MKFLIKMHPTKNYLYKRQNSHINLGIIIEILNSFKNKNRKHRKVIRAKDPVRKTNLENEYRMYKPN